MALEPCAICKEDCTPWREIELIGTVCNDCSSDAFIISEKPIGYYLEQLVKDKKKCLEFLKYAAKYHKNETVDDLLNIKTVALKLLKQIGELP